MEFYNYNPEWEVKAEDIINQLKSIFKENVIDIQHIGGTAVKRIKSKPVIDIVVGLDNLNILENYIDILKSNGFIYNNKKIFYRHKTCVVYFVKYNSKSWFDYIVFRDYLNLNENKAREYETLKLSVNGKYKNALPSYIKAKSDFINKTISDNFYTVMLGKNITVDLDCKNLLNYPKYDDGVYPLNYGNIKNLGINAYVIGIYDYDMADQFTGKIIAYIDNGNEKIFIAAKKDMIFYKPDILKAVKFLNIEYKNIVCLYEKSCGAVVFAKDEDIIKFLLIKGSASNSIGFPKGHIEENETEAETAIREIYEETSLNVILHSDFKEEYEYKIYGHIYKKVVCFLAEFNITDKYKIRDNEILEQWLVPYDKAYELLTFSQAKNILKKAYEKIKNIK